MLIEGYKSLVQQLANTICNKRIIYEPNISPYQTANEIRVSNFTEDIHEIAHWIAADPTSRTLFNLGLPTEEDEKMFRSSVIKDKLSERMYKEECVALILTKLIFDKMVINRGKKLAKYEDYVTYMHGQSKAIASKFNFCYENIKELASSLFSHYVIKKRNSDDLFEGM